jgi:hypothetical protein
MNSLEFHSMWSLCLLRARTVPGLEQLLSGFSSRRSEFSPSVVYVEFIVEVWQCGRFLSAHLGCSFTIVSYLCVLRGWHSRSTWDRSAKGLSLTALVKIENGRSKVIKKLRVLVRQRTIPTERPPLVGEVNANFSGERMSRGQRNQSPRPLISVF